MCMWARVTYHWVSRLACLSNLNTRVNYRFHSSGFNSYSDKLLLLAGKQWPVARRLLLSSQPGGHQAPSRSRDPTAPSLLPVLRSYLCCDQPCAAFPPATCRRAVAEVLLVWNGDDPPSLDILDSPAPVRIRTEHKVGAAGGTSHYSRACPDGSLSRCLAGSRWQSSICATCCLQPRAGRLHAAP